MPRLVSPAQDKRVADPLPMPADDALSAGQRAVLHRAPLNVFRMAAHVEGVLEPFYDMTVAMLRRGKLDARSRELLILRTAGLNGADYEWRHHALIAARLGVPEAEVERLRAPGEVPGLSEDDALLVRAAGEIALDGGAGADTMAALRRRYPVAVVVEIVFCCSYYNMVSRFLVSTGTPFEEGGVSMDGALGGLE